MVTGSVTPGDPLQLFSHRRNKDVKKQFDILGNMLICFLAESLMRIFLPLSCFCIRYGAGAKKKSV